MKLNYLNCSNYTVRRTFVADIPDMDTAISFIREWCVQYNIDCQRLRIIDHQKCWWFDFGSYSRFFELVKGLDKAQVV